MGSSDQGPTPSTRLLPVDAAMSSKSSNSCLSPARSETIGRRHPPCSRLVAESPGRTAGRVSSARTKLNGTRTGAAASNPLQVEAQDSAKTQDSAKRREGDV